ncbi:alkaline phosphatase family protein [Paenibacillus barcinonensis]|uniref:alkaline phosphatase family protein n=1 Tax=Paenibacillus barcinonensis TaxID=198119 RepID=UPI001ABF99C9|nr:alkaline phosphatase family protein [Paenibacillus barcinonensis]
MQKLMNEGILPNLQVLASEGEYSEIQPPYPNCQTPPSLATLFTGSSLLKHGITGFRVPNYNNVRFPEVGFNIPLQVETIWEHLNIFGYVSSFSHIPWVKKKYLSENKNSNYIEGYSSPLLKSGAVRIENIDMDVPMTLNLESFTFQITTRNTSVKVKEISTQKSIDYCYSSNLEFKMFNNKNQGTLIAVYQDFNQNLYIVHTGIWEVVTHGEFSPDCKTFIGEGLGRLYRSGFFGPKLVEGGDGFAERCLTDSILQVGKYFAECANNVIQNSKDSQLVLSYQPCIDDIEHELLGWCDPASNRYSSEHAEAIWSYIKEVYQFVDNHLGHIKSFLSSGDLLFVTSDHGMAGVSQMVNINELFRMHGLLSVDSDNCIDLDDSLVIYHPANNGSIWILNPKLKGDESLIAYKSRIVKSVIDILTHWQEEYGNKVIGEIISLIDKPREGTDMLGDMLILAAPGYEFSANLQTKGRVVVPFPKTASHGTYNGLQSLHGIFVGAIVGSTKVSLKKPINNNQDIFPFICNYFNLQLPNHLS